jgi:hypothetical protein
MADWIIGIVGVIALIVVAWVGAIINTHILRKCDRNPYANHDKNEPKNGLQ